MIAALLLLLAPDAQAQSCSCSVGGGGGASLPSAMVPVPGAVTVGLSYDANQTGGDGWNGLYALDRDGNSMSTMAMPGHLVQGARADLSVGLPAGFSTAASLAWSYSHPLYPSDMKGDVDQGFLGDAALSGLWSLRGESRFVAVGAGVTLPTGKVVDGYGVRGGRGAVGLTGTAQLALEVSPFLTLGATTSGSYGPVESAIDQFRVAPSLTSMAGARWSPREQGKLTLDGWLGHTLVGRDQRSGVVLEETGLSALELGVGPNFRFWSKKSRTATWLLRATAPIAQVAGDPWLEKNWTLTTGVSALVN
jgi:hypothetical protein